MFTRGHRSEASHPERTATMTNATDKPTIVLIHGLWMTPRSWEHWIARFEGFGYEVIAPPYPGFEVEVEALRADPSPIEKLTIDSVADHYEEIIRALPAPPIIIGHSFGGTLTQLLHADGRSLADDATAATAVLGPHDLAPLAAAVELDLAILEDDVAPDRVDELGVEGAAL